MLYFIQIHSYSSESIDTYFVHAYKSIFFFFNNSIITTLPKLGIKQRHVQQRDVEGTGNFCERSRSLALFNTPSENTVYIS